MGWFEDTTGISTPDFIKDIEDETRSLLPSDLNSISDIGDDFDRDIAKLTGKSGQEKDIAAAEAAQQDAIDEAILEQQTAAQEAIGFFDPFKDIESKAVADAGFLTDPQQQFDFLQNNPLYASALENANRVTLSNQAARGKLGSGDTLTALTGNTLLQAAPLIADQKSSIAGLLDFARGNATTRANARIGQGTNVSNLLQSSGNATAAANIARSNASAASRQSLFGLAGTLGGAALAGPIGGIVGGAGGGALGGGLDQYNLDYSQATYF